MPRIMRRILTILIFGVLPAAAQAVTLTAQEKEFQESMANVLMEGGATRDGKEGVSTDKYSVVKVEKTGPESWTFQVKVNMKGTEVVLPLPIDIKWAGDTPVITLTDKILPGMGTYTARVVIYRGNYAGTWSGAHGGGKVFGKLTKQP